MRFSSEEPRMVMCLIHMVARVVIDLLRTKQNPFIMKGGSVGANALDYYYLLESYLYSA